jgi:hypothetical protein
MKQPTFASVLRRRSFAYLVILLLTSALQSIAGAALAAEEDASIDCKDVEKNSPSLLEAERQQQDADEDLAKKTDALRRAETDYKEAKDADKTNAKTAFDSAQSAYINAVKASNENWKTLTCVTARLEEARTWRYGFLLGAHAAMDAPQDSKIGLQAQFVWHPYGLQLFRESETVVRWSRFKHVNSEAEDVKRHGAEVIQRVGFPVTSNINFDVGAGLGFLEAKDKYAFSTAVTGDIGLGLRFGQWLRISETTGLVDTRIFMQPWVPTDGSPVTVFFGIELGGGVATNRVGNGADLRLGKDYSFKEQDCTNLPKCTCDELNKLIKDKNCTSDTPAK